MTCRCCKDVADKLVYYADRIVIAEPYLHKGAKFTKWAYQIADDMRNDAAVLMPAQPKQGESNE